MVGYYTVFQLVCASVFTVETRAIEYDLTNCGFKRGVDTGVMC